MWSVGLSCIWALAQALNKTQIWIGGKKCVSRDLSNVINQRNQKLQSRSDPFHVSEEVTKRNPRSKTQRVLGTGLDIIQALKLVLGVFYPQHSQWSLEISKNNFVQML